MCLTFRPIGQQPTFWRFLGSGGPFNSSYPYTDTVSANKIYRGLRLTWRSRFNFNRVQLMW
jgi:hypothetical protein